MAKLEHLLLARSSELSAILDAAERRIDQGKGIRHDEFWREVEAVGQEREKNGVAKKRRSKRRS